MNITRQQTAYANVPTTLCTAAETGFSFDGYDFLGWNEISTETTAAYLDGQSNVSFAKDTTLYAIWKKRSGIIEKTSIADAKVINTMSNGYFYSSISSSFNYDTYAPLKVQLGEKTLKKNVDYSILVTSEDVYADNAPFKATISGINDYKDSIQFNIPAVKRCYSMDFYITVDKTSLPQILKYDSSFVNISAFNKGINCTKTLVTTGNDTKAIDWNEELTMIGQMYKMQIKLDDEITLSVSPSNRYDIDGWYCMNDEYTPSAMTYHGSSDTFKTNQFKVIKSHKHEALLKVVLNLKTKTVPDEPSSDSPVVETVPSNSVNTADIKAFNDGYDLRFFDKNSSLAGI